MNLSLQVSITFLSFARWLDCTRCSTLVEKGPSYKQICVSFISLDQKHRVGTNLISFLIRPPSIAIYLEVKITIHHNSGDLSNFYKPWLISFMQIQNDAAKASFRSFWQPVNICLRPESWISVLFSKSFVYSGNNSYSEGQAMFYNDRWDSEINRNFWKLDIDMIWGDSCRCSQSR